MSIKVFAKKAQNSTNQVKASMHNAIERFRHKLSSLMRKNQTPPTQQHYAPMPTYIPHAANTKKNIEKDIVDMEESFIRSSNSNNHRTEKPLTIEQQLEKMEEELMGSTTTHDMNVKPLTIEQQLEKMEEELMGSTTTHDAHIKPLTAIERQDMLLGIKI
jgi:hypothetical protein